MHRTMYRHPEAHDATRPQDKSSLRKKESNINSTPTRANKWYQNGISPEVVNPKEEKDGESIPQTPIPRHLTIHTR